MTITNDGLKSIRKYSDYIIKKVMNEQLNKESALFQALCEYYRSNVFLSLKQSNIANKQNLYELALDDIVEHGWLTEMKSIEDNIPPRSYRTLLEKLRSFYKKEQPSQNEKSNVIVVPSTNGDLHPASTTIESDTTVNEKSGNLNLIDT
jgi:hypothetical protein